ncbi:hypothetical protein C8R43DRAFT_878961 [Mycena crocata]|nr:hypothetical protein C8R43DRAFT_878961 [Mycena crocata]
MSLSFADLTPFSYIEVLEEPKPNNTSTAAPPPPHPPSIPPQAIHVQPHSNPATTTPALHKIPFEAQAVINRVLKSLQNIIAPEWKWKSWIPQHLSKRAEDAEIYAWLSGLEIPELNGQPSLLLHGLGNLQNDPEMISRLSKIFLLSKVTSLVNTAGSGKTRHVLEGLCREWGFYICSTVETEAFGSKDLMDCIETCIPATPGFTAVLPDNSDPGFAESLARNRKIAADALFQVMLARTIIFREFLNAIVASGRKIVEDDKRRWVYIQIHPAVLGPSFDVFNELARVLNKHAISAVACRQIIRTLFDEQQAIISDHSENPVDKAGFHCVLDEAQFAANHLPLAFRSEDGLTRRSILREVIVVLSILLVGSRYGVEISGTGVDKQVVDMTMSSVIVKASRSTWTSLTGSFVKNESSGLQEKYIRQYLPPRLLKSVVGQRLIKRMGHWLEGRFRFTAAFLANLFMSDFGNPHQFLDDWVEYHTKFRPTDAPDLRSSPTPVTKHFSTAPLHTKIDFKRFHGQSIVTLTSAIYESLIRANYTGTLQGKAHQMVEAGFARYKPQDSNTSESDRAAISEPLILLASATILREQSTDPEVNDLWQYLVVQIGSNKSSVNNGFENYIAFLMADVFSKPTCLKDVFEFSETRPVPDWANQTARLVALHCDADSNGTQPAVHEVDWPNRAVPGGQFGYDYDTKNVAATTIGWLQHRYKVPFCFPPKAMGPDIISVLQLQNKKLLWVLIQCKYYSAALTSRDLDAAVESTAPLSWWVDAVRKPFPCHFTGRGF